VDVECIGLRMTATASTTVRCSCLILLQRAPVAPFFIALSPSRASPSPCLSSLLKTKTICKGLDTSLIMVPDPPSSVPRPRGPAEFVSPPPLRQPCCTSRHPCMRGHPPKLIEKSVRLQRRPVISALPLLINDKSFQDQEIFGDEGAPAWPSLRRELARQPTVRGCPKAIRTKSAIRPEDSRRFPAAAHGLRFDAMAGTQRDAS
jgi:hypothetical protein